MLQYKHFEEAYSEEDVQYRNVDFAPNTVNSKLSSLKTQTTYSHLFSFHCPRFSYMLLYLLRNNNK